MTGLEFLRTCASKVSSVTTLVAPTVDHTFPVGLALCGDSTAGSGLLRRQPALGVDRRGASGARGGNGLPVGTVHHVGAREHALARRPRRPLSHEQGPVR